MHYVILDYELQPFSQAAFEHIIEAVKNATGLDIALPTETATDEDGNEIEVPIEKDWTVEEIQDFLASLADVTVQVLNAPEPEPEEGEGEEA